MVSQLRSSRRLSREARRICPFIAVLRVTLGASLAVLLCAVVPADAGSEGLRRIEVIVTRGESQKRLLAVNGSSISDPGDEYSVEVDLLRVPCDGYFTYHSYGEDRRSDVETEFHTLVRIERVRTTPPGLSCGEPLPDNVGRKRSQVLIWNALATPFRLDAGPRRPDQTFRGVLTLNQITGCEQSYGLSVTISNPATWRQYRYRVTFLAADAFRNGMPIKVPGCPPLDAG